MGSRVASFLHRSLQPESRLGVHGPKASLTNGVKGPKHLLQPCYCWAEPPRPKGWMKRGRCPRIACCWGRDKVPAESGTAGKQGCCFGIKHGSRQAHRERFHLLQAACLWPCLLLGTLVGMLCRLLQWDPLPFPGQISPSGLCLASGGHF